MNLCEEHANNEKAVAAIRYATPHAARGWSDLSDAAQGDATFTDCLQGALEQLYWRGLLADAPTVRDELATGGRSWRALAGFVAAAAAVGVAVGRRK